MRAAPDCQRYNSEKDEFYVMGHEDDEEFTRAFWKKMLNSYCEPGCVRCSWWFSEGLLPTIRPDAHRFLC